MLSYLRFFFFQAGFLVCFASTVQAEFAQIGVDARLSGLLNDVLSEEGAPSVDIFFTDSASLEKSRQFDLLILEDSLPERGVAIRHQLVIKDRLALFTAETQHFQGLTKIDALLRVANVIGVVDPRQHRSGRDALRVFEKTGIMSEISGKILPVLDVRAFQGLLHHGSADLAVAYQSELFLHFRHLAMFSERTTPAIRYYLWQLTAEGGEGYDFLVSPSTILLLKDRGFSIVQAP